MKHRTVTEIRDDYVRSIKGWTEVSLGDDNDTASAAFHTMIHRYLELRSLGDEGLDALLSLLQHEDPAVSLLAALHTYQQDPKRSIARVEELSKALPPGILRVNANQCLRQMVEGSYKDPTEWPQYLDWKSRDWAPLS